MGFGFWVGIQPHRPRHPIRTTSSPRQTRPAPSGTWSMVLNVRHTAAPIYTPGHAHLYKCYAHLYKRSRPFIHAVTPIHTLTDRGRHLLHLQEPEAWCRVCADICAHLYTRLRLSIHPLTPIYTKSRPVDTLSDRGRHPLHLQEPGAWCRV